MKKKIIIIVIAINAVLLCGYAAYRGYKVWKQSHMLELARGFIAKSDTRNAVLSLQQVLRANPANVEACRLMAQLTEAARSPSALLWRRRVADLNPKSNDDRLALAQAAMVFRDFTTATNALDAVDAAGKKTPAYHNLAGAMAAAMNLGDAAESHFLEASRLEPGNIVPQLNLAVVRLHRSNALDMAEARISLKRISANPTNGSLRCTAMREIVGDALRTKDNATALATSNDLVGETNSVFSDRLLRLDVLRQAKSPEYQPALATYRREAGTNSAKIYEMATWQNNTLSPGETLLWLKSLPSEIQTNQPTTLLIAESLVLTKDWAKLQEWLQPQRWNELEFVKQAFLSRALRGQDLDAASKASWELAVKATGQQKQALIMLFRLAAQWRWISEGEDVLWSIVNSYPDEKWAVQALSQALIVGGRTRPLMALFNQQVKAGVNDLAVKNNLAMTAFLLEAKERKPHDLAEEVYTKAPTNASFASTYAFSLYLQNKPAEALKVMQTLRQEQVSDPSVAGYYGLVLKANGDKNRARAYLERAYKAPLLPEEKRLFDAAKVGI